MRSIARGPKSPVGIMPDLHFAVLGQPQPKGLIANVPLKRPKMKIHKNGKQYNLKLWS
jgi:hypothetical protein